MRGGRGVPQTMANYTRRNLSQYAQETSMAFFRTWATMVRQPGRESGSASAASCLSGRTFGPMCVVRTGAGPFLPRAASGAGQPAARHRSPI